MLTRSNQKNGIIAFLLVLSVFITLCACGSEKQNVTNKTNSNIATTLKGFDSESGESEISEKNITASADNADITVEGCNFAKEIQAKDGEVSTNSYPEIEGKIYVDFVAVVKNNGKKEISADSFSGYITYDELRYDFQYCSDSYTCVSVRNDAVPANETKRIHLFTRLPAEAENKTDLEAIVSICGKEYKEIVKPNNNADALSTKTELKKGDKGSWMNGAVEYEVINCVYSKYMTATDYSNAEQYMAANKKIADVIIKIKNNTENEIADIFGYVKTGETAVRAHMKVETENNTKIDFGGVEAGKTETVHLYVEVDENTDANDIILRFNFDSNCYYIRPEQS